VPRAGYELERDAERRGARPSARDRVDGVDLAVPPRRIFAGAERNEYGVVLFGASL